MTISRLLYVLDLPEAVPPVVHISFLLDRIGGTLRPPTNEFDQNPIGHVGMVPIEELVQYGFSEEFGSLVAQGFPGSGAYKGHKSAIGL
ncbi:MutT/Nudix family protein [mine drainage metagenome]|uniref:MutT/Nudix family protein n=1 Tax=mine drainage metagenome TaxID=410659 RepID=T0YXP5_9ZZZZ